MPSKSVDVVDRLVRKHEAKTIADIGWTPEAREAAAAARVAARSGGRGSQTEARNIGRGMGQAISQQQQNEQRFPVGSFVRLNHMGSEGHAVVGHAGPMVHTSGGDFHHTKIVPALGQGYHGTIQTEQGSRSTYIPTREESNEAAGRSPNAVSMASRQIAQARGWRQGTGGGARGGYNTGRRRDSIERLLDRNEAKHIADIGWTEEARAAAAAARAGRQGQSSSKPFSQRSRPIGSATTSQAAQAAARAASKTPAKSMLQGLGFNHSPGSGYKPELNAYQHYNHPTGIGFDQLQHSFMQAGFHQTMPMRGGVMSSFPGQQTMHVASFSRTAAPYREETISVASKDGGRTIHQASHYNGSLSGDRATTKLVQQHEAKQIVDQLVGKE